MQLNQRHAKPGLIFKQYWIIEGLQLFPLAGIIFWQK